MAYHVFLRRPAGRRVLESELGLSARDAATVLQSKVPLPVGIFPGKEETRRALRGLRKRSVEAVALDLQKLADVSVRGVRRATKAGSSVMWSESNPQQTKIRLRIDDVKMILTARVHRTTLPESGLALSREYLDRVLRIRMKAPRRPFEEEERMCLLFRSRRSVFGVRENNFDFTRTFGRDTINTAYGFQELVKMVRGMYPSAAFNDTLSTSPSAIRAFGAVTGLSRTSDCMLLAAQVLYQRDMDEE